MIKKNTTLGVLLLLGAVFFTSCVKDDESATTKSLREAKETEALANIDKTHAEEIKTLVELQKTYLSEISQAEKEINETNAVIAKSDADKAGLDAKLTRDKEAKDRQITGVNDLIKRAEAAHDDVATLNVLKNQLKALEEEKTELDRARKTQEAGVAYLKKHVEDLQTQVATKSKALAKVKEQLASLGVN